MCDAGIVRVYRCVSLFVAENDGRVLMERRDKNILYGEIHSLGDNATYLVCVQLSDIENVSRYPHHSLRTVGKSDSIEIKRIKDSLCAPDLIITRKM